MYAIVGTLDETVRRSSQLQDLCELVQQKPELKQILRLGVEQEMLSVLERLSDVLKATIFLCAHPLMPSHSLFLLNGP